MQAGGKKKVFAGGDTIHLTFSNFEDVLDLIGETERLQDVIPDRREMPCIRMFPSIRF